VRNAVGSGRIGKWLKRLPSIVVGLGFVAGTLGAQERGAADLLAAVDGIGVSARVLVIAAHPDDEDTNLITWLARGRHVETAYLSLTRGDGGQNLIGNELGESLGAIRTQELLAARRIDGAKQYFARAFDFGFSKTADETLTQWAKDSLLRDVITVVRSFRPHVIVSVFSGTPSDGHGHHQVAGILAREAYDLSGDVSRFPAAATAGFTPWTVQKFYRSANFRFQDRATLRVNVGEFSPLLGRSFAEIAAESRSRHRSQAFGSLQTKGPRFALLLREATRTNDQQPARDERSLFDGIDTTWNRFREAVRVPRRRAALDSLAPAFREARLALDLRRPASVLPALARVQRLMDAVCGEASPDNPCASLAGDGSLLVRDPDLFRTMENASVRAQWALQLAAGVAVEATAPREVWAAGEPVPVSIAIYNRGTSDVRVTRRVLLGPDSPPVFAAGGPRTIAPDSIHRDSLTATIRLASQPWWLAAPRHGAMFGVAGSPSDEGGRRRGATVVTSFEVSGAPFSIFAPVVHRFADPVRGEINRPMALAPPVTVTLDREIEYAPAGVRLERAVRVHLQSHSGTRRLVDVRLTLPPGLGTNEPVQRVELARAGDVRTVSFTITGQLPSGRHVISATASAGAETFRSGYTEVRYEHIETQRLYRPSTLALQAVDVRVPSGTTVAYINGVGDNSAAMLAQLGVDVTVVDPADLGQLDLSKYSAVVVGTRAYEASQELVMHNARLLEYAQRGGTLVVQYGQYEMTAPGIMPYPITLSRPADRVTVENAPVQIIDPASPVLVAPNRITAADFEGWQQDRSLYMPRTFDPAFRASVETNDPGDAANRGGILVAPYGSGTYVYTTLAFFRQLPNGIPGAARLFVNLLAARAPRVTQ
jgi:LmbE family N-acetylglucosaminyl deacetylase